MTGASKILSATTGNVGVDADVIMGDATFGRLSVIVTVWASLTMFVEGFELQLVGYAAPAMIRALDVSKAEFGAIFGAGNAGFFCGALLLSAFGDRSGRRRLIVTGVLIFSVCTLAAAYGTGVTTLAVLRFLAGIGLGGAVPNVIALTAEYAPRGKQASRITLLYVAYVLGGAGAGLLVSWLVPKFGWPIIFTVGGWSGLLCGFLLYLFVPESPSFLSHHRSNASPPQMQGCGVPVTQSDKPIGAERQGQPKAGIPFIALFRGGRLPTTLLLWLPYPSAMITSQFITSWLPTLIAGAWAGISLAALISSLYHVGGAAGNVIMGQLADRRGLKMVAVGFSLAVPATASMGLACSSLPLLAVTTLCIGILMVGSLNGINAAAGMLYPTAMRSSGVGWMSGVGRIGSILGPVMGRILISLNMAIPTLFLILAVPVAFTAIFMSCLVYTASRS